MKLLAWFALFLVAAVPASAQSFGGSAAVLGNEVLFGQPQSGQEPGAVFAFRHMGEGWERTARLAASDGFTGDGFGSFMVGSGDWVAISAPNADNRRGAVYVFQRSNGTWSQTAKLTVPGVVEGAQFGVEMGRGEDLLLIATADGENSPGSVHVFRWGAGGFAPAGELPRPPAIGNDEGFGRTLAVVGGSPMVAAAGADSGIGAVYVYAPAGSGWSAPVKVAGSAPGGRFGAGAGVVDGYLVVGAPVVDQAIGEAVLFENQDGEWVEVQRFRPDDAGPQTVFGANVIARGQEAWITAPGADGFRGAVYVYRIENGQATFQTKIGGTDLSPGAAFGVALGVTGDVAALGVPGDDFGAGTGSIFVADGGDWTLASEVSVPLSSLDAVAGAEVSCEAGKAAHFGCSDVTLLSFIPVGSIGGTRGVELNDVWGWTDPQDGREFALVGRVDGTSFVDVTDPMNPIYVGDLPKTEGSPGSTWRDIKVYRDHAYIVADNAGHHGVQVFDLTRLRNVENAPATFAPDAWYGEIHSAHNIVINTESGFAYAVGSGNGGETCGGGLHMIDIRDPKNPRFAGCFSDPSTGREGTGYTHDAQCVTYRGPDPDYQGREICFGSNETALSIADVTDKGNPTAVSMAEYPNVGYTHQAWLTDDQKYLLMGDELDEMNGLVEHTRTLIWDVSDLDDPIVIKEYLNPNGTAIDHNQYVKGDKIYQSNYVQGLRILDISDVTEPVEVGFFDTVPYGDDGARFDGSWSNYPYFDSGTIVVTSGDEGLFLLRYVPSGDKPIS